MRQIIARHDADTAPGPGPRPGRVIRLSRGGLAGVVAACAVLAGGGVAAASFLGTGTSSGARQAAVKNLTAG